MEIPRGGGGGEVARAKVFKEKYGVKLEFPAGWGCKPINHFMGEHGYFLEPHIWKKKFNLVQFWRSEIGDLCDKPLLKVCELMKFSLLLSLKQLSLSLLRLTL